MLLNEEHGARQGKTQKMAAQGTQSGDCAARP